MASEFERFLAKYGKEPLIILTHNKADPDAIASAFALHKALPNSVIATHEEMREGAKRLVERFNIKIYTLDQLKKEDWAGLVVVDTSSYTLVPQARGWKVLLIIDHHKSEGRDMEGEFNIIDEEAASAAEVVCGLLKEVDKEAAFALAVAIVADGARFKSARLQSFEQLARMMRICGAPYSELLEYAEPELPPDKKLAILNTAFNCTVEVVAGYVVARGVAKEGGESDVSSFLTEMADVAFVSRRKGEETRISARARKHVHVPLQKVMAAVASSLGGQGGGHAKAAGASVRADPEVALEECITQFTLLATGRSG